MSRLVVSFSVALLLLLAVVVLSRIAYGNTQVQAIETEHSRTVISLYYRLDVDLRSAEIFTPTYRDSVPGGLYQLYEADLQNIAPSLQQLKALEARDAQQTALINRLESVVAPNLPLLQQKNLSEIIRSEGIERLRTFAEGHRLIREGLALEETQLADSKKELDTINNRYHSLSTTLSALALVIILGAFFNQFSLSKKSRRLEGFLEAVLNTSHNAVLHLKAVHRKGETVDFRLAFANSASEGWLDAPPRTLVGKRWSEIAALRRSSLFEVCKGVTETGQQVELNYFDQEAAVPRSYTLAVAKLKNGVTLTAYESTEIKATALALKKNISALELSNKELEEYAYAASHDLQEPLRKIITFGTFLKDTQYERLDERGRQQVDKILVSTERMSLLIKDLLSYSGLKAAEQFEATDLNDVLEAVLQDLEVMIAQKGAVITHDRLPEIQAIPVQMNQLFYNLVNNSLKYAKTDVPLHLDVSCKQVHGGEVTDVPELNAATRYHEIIFSDNGVGFNQQYARQIFGLFKRLHDRSQYTGSGIGLALCKRVAANHGGVIIANGKAGVGAQFYIYLPVWEEK